MLMKDGENHFTIGVDIAVSPQFLAWVFGFGADAEIISPENVRERMKKQVEEVYGIY